MLVEKTGSSAELTTGNKKDFEQDGSSRGIMKQLIGTEAELQTTPFSWSNYGADTPNGTFQLTGEHANLDKTPDRGWESYPTPMSDRAKRGA